MKLVLWSLILHLSFDGINLRPFLQVDQTKDELRPTIIKLNPIREEATPSVRKLHYDALTDQR